MHYPTDAVSDRVTRGHVNQRADIKHGDHVDEDAGHVLVEIVESSLDVSYVLLRVVAVLER